MEETELPAMYNDQNFKRSQYWKNLQNAQFVKFVLYDEEYKAKEVLQFESHYRKNGWFSSQKLLNSSFWDMSTLQEANFTLTNSGFEITTNNEEECEEEGFVKLTCDIETACAQLKWWLVDETLKEQPCGIVYSKRKTAVDYNKGFWAFRIQILTK